MTGAAARTAACYGALFLAFGAHLPYWPLWLADRGLSEAEIGFYLGLAVLARIAGAMLIPALADRIARRRQVLALSALGAAALILAHLGLTDPAMLLAATLLSAFVMAPTVPLGEALGLRAAGQFGFAYAPVRAVGSIAFLCANLGVGWLIGTQGPDAALWTVVAGFLAVAVLAPGHPGGGAPPRSGSDRAGRGEALALLRHPVFLCFALASALGQGSHAVYYVYSSLDWEARGISAAAIGGLWAAGVAAETLLMLGPGRRWVAWLGAPGALAIAAGAGVIRWLAMAAGPDLALLWPVQLLHAITFAMAHLAAMAFVAAAVPARLAATAQGLLSGPLGGSVMAVAFAGAAALVSVGGISAAYLMAAGMSGGSVLAGVWLSRLWTGAALRPETGGTP